MSDERRSAKRHVLWVPVELRAGEEVYMLAVSRNISLTGVLVVAGAELTAGERVNLSFMVPHVGQWSAEGEIVRVQVNEEDPEGPWKYLLAVRFDEAVPELEEALEKLEAST